MFKHSHRYPEQQWPLAPTANLAKRPMETYGAVVFLVFLLLITIGPTPFKEGSGLAIDQSGAGEWLRQTLLLILAVFAWPVFVARREGIMRVASSNWAAIALFGWAALSVLWSDFPDIALHRLLGTLLCAVLVMIGVCLSSRSIVTVLLLFTGAIMVTDYVGVFLRPDLALDPDGLWKGMHLQKNLAGYFSAIASLVWLLLGFRRRCGWLIAGGVAWLVFLWFSHSKTSLGMYVPALLFGGLLSIGLRKGINKFVFYFIAGLVFVLLPLWAYFLHSLSLNWFDILVLGDADLTFTGRTEIWDFVWNYVLDAPIAGVGYGSFWAVGERSPALLWASDFVAQYTETHNGYLDVLVTTGSVGLVLLTATILQPYRILAGYRLVSLDTVDDDALLVFATLLTFGVLHNFLESTALQGMSAVWTLMLFSIWSISALRR